MRFFSIFRPTPLAFVAFFFAYALQVITRDERWGLVPYALLVPSMVLTLLRALSGKTPRSSSIRGLDVFVSLFVILAGVHAVVGTLMHEYGPDLAVRLLMIYVGASWIYFYVSRHATESMIGSIMMAIAVSALIMSLQWSYETYTKMVRQQVTRFQELSFEYKKMRNGLTDEEMNPSTLGTQYRAHGLADSYPTTGALVAVGAFAALALYPGSTRKRRLMVLGVFLGFLLIGFATTALVSYLCLFPVVLWLTGRERNTFGILRVALYVTISFVALILVALAFPAGRELLANSTDLLRIQIGNVLTLTPGNISFYRVYRAAILLYATFIAQKPLAILVGEGPQGYGSVVFSRGGDLGFLDFMAGFGIPFAILFLIACISALIRAVTVIRSKALDAGEMVYAVFGFASVTFLLMSLIHYAVLFNKTALALFYLGLGLLRRYSYRRRRSQVTPSTAAVHVRTREMPMAWPVPHGLAELSRVNE